MARNSLIGLGGPLSRVDRAELFKQLIEEANPELIEQLAKKFGPPPVPEEQAEQSALLRRRPGPRRDPQIDVMIEWFFANPDLFSQEVFINSVLVMKGKKAPHPRTIEKRIQELRELRSKTKNK